MKARKIIKRIDGGDAKYFFSKFNEGARFCVFKNTTNRTSIKISLDTNPSLF